MACGDDIGHAVGKLTLRHDLEHSVCQAPSEALLALLAFTSPSCLLPWVGHGRGGQERLCVRVAGRVCDDVHRPLFHDLSVAEYRHPVRHVAYDGEVVGDEQVAEAEFSLQVLQEVEDLGLDGEVQGASGFVADDDVGFEDQGTCDGDALALSAGELCRVAEGGVGGQADAFEDVGDLCRKLATAGSVMGPDWVGEGLPDGAGRVEGAVGVLEDDL